MIQFVVEAHEADSALNRDGGSGAQVGSLLNFFAQLFTRIFDEHIEVTVTTNFKNLGAYLHA
jgi:hypothetical protein